MHKHVSSQSIVEGSVSLTTEKKVTRSISGYLNFGDKKKKVEKIVPTQSSSSTTFVTDKQLEVIKKYDKILEKSPEGKFQWGALTRADRREYVKALDYVNRIEENPYMKDVTFSKVAKRAALNEDYSIGRDIAKRIQNPTVRESAYKRIALEAAKKRNVCEFKETLEEIINEDVRAEASREGEKFLGLKLRVKTKLSSVFNKVINQ